MVSLRPGSAVDGSYSRYLHRCYRTVQLRPTAVSLRRDSVDASGATRCQFDVVPELVLEALRRRRAETLVSVPELVFEALGGKLRASRAEFGKWFRVAQHRNRTARIWNGDSEYQ